MGTKIPTEACSLISVFVIHCLGGHEKTYNGTQSDQSFCYSLSWSGRKYCAVWSASLLFAVLVGMKIPTKGYSLVSVFVIRCLGGNKNLQRRAVWSACLLFAVLVGMKIPTKARSLISVFVIGSLGGDENTYKGAQSDQHLCYSLSWWGGKYLWMRAVWSASLLFPVLVGTKIVTQ